jgi:superfamily II DNA/RNA helicase
MTFDELSLDPRILEAVKAAGYMTPTPIQAQGIPAVLGGRDITGIAQTGTGKTAAFVLPMIHKLGQGRAKARMPRSLILEPTRELAAQVAENFEKYGANYKLNMALLIGGVSFGDQDKKLMAGVDVLIATPGRLMDHFERGKLLLTGVQMLVIDEADRMLDMGFIPDIEFICSKLPETRQTMLFSATMPPPIEKLAKKFLTNPKRIEVSRAASTNADITAFKVPVKSRAKKDTLRWFLENDLVETAIIFANRKTTVRELNQSLTRFGFRSSEIHGDMEQSSRIKELERFKAGEVNILVASDVAARGLDIKGVSHVFNYDTPWHPDDYVHRIGRTGRAGAKGRAFTFVSEEDAEAISNVEKLTGSAIKVFGKEDVRVDLSEAIAKAEAAQAEAPREEREERAERPERPERSERKPRKARDEQREDREPREERAPRAERAPREERAERPRREKSAPRTDQVTASDDRKPRRRYHEDDEPVPAGEWNGPRPAFLDISFD